MRVAELSRCKDAKRQRGKAFISLCIHASMRLCIFFCFLLFAALPLFAQDMVIKAGVSIDKIPKEFYGTWRVSSKRLSTNDEGMFRENNVDLWNLSRAGNVITLDNPFSGAHASIMVDSVQGQFIKFKKTGDYDSQKLTDTVRLNLEKDSFTGVNDLKLDTLSDVDGRVIITKWASYSLKGEKISGEAIK